MQVNPLPGCFKWELSLITVSDIAMALERQVSTAQWGREQKLELEICLKISVSFTKFCSKPQPKHNPVFISSLLMETWFHWPPAFSSGPVDACVCYRAPSNNAVIILFFFKIIISAAAGDLPVPSQQLPHILTGDFLNANPSLKR